MQILINLKMDVFFFFLNSEKGKKKKTPYLSFASNKRRNATKTLHGFELPSSAKTLAMGRRSRCGTEEGGDLKKKDGGKKKNEGRTLEEAAKKKTPERRS